MNDPFFDDSENIVLLKSEDTVLSEELMAWLTEHTPFAKWTFRKTGDGKVFLVFRFDNAKQAIHFKMAWYVD